MTTVTAEEARTKLSDILNRAAYRNEPTVLTRHGKGIAVVISIEDFELLQEFIKEMEDKADLGALRKGLREYKEGKTISLDELKAEIGL